MRVFVLFALVGCASAYYECTAGKECTDAYGAPVSGSESTLAAACDADNSCVQFQYNPSLDYGVRANPNPMRRICSSSARFAN